MSNHTVDSDFALNIYSSRGSTALGHDSKYVDTEHPGTGKKITGWPWDRRMWPDARQADSDHFAPNFWNSSTNFIPETYYQSGYGSGKDILFMGLFDRSANNTTRWNPRVHSGQYYRHTVEHCLFSKYHQTEYVSPNDTTSGLLYFHDLGLQPQPTHPITLRRYERNISTGDVTFDVTAKHRYAFTGTTISGVEQDTVDADRNIDVSAIDFSKPEFIVDIVNYTPPRIITNTGFRTVGNEITTISGGMFTNPDDIAGLELLGISDETANQDFTTRFFPLDKTQSLEVWVYPDPYNAEQYTVVSGVRVFSAGANQEVYVDYDRGIIGFGNQTNGLIPPVGSRIGIRYTAGLEVQYEPDYSQNDYEPEYLNLHPLYQSAYRGFLQLTTKEDQVGSISLSTLLTQTGSDTYSIETGNNSGQILATVLNQDGFPMEGVTVDFTLPDPYLGSFSDGSQSKSAITNVQGQASVFYVAPSNVDELGDATDQVTYDGADTVLEISGVPVPDTVSGEFYLWKVATTDHTLGVNQNDLTSEYTAYETEAEIGSGSSIDEIEYRTLNLLPLIQTYSDGDLITGAKQLVVAQREVVNPHTGTLDASAYGPLYPSLIENIGSATSPQLRLTYSNVTLDDPQVSSSFKSYFAAGGNRVTLQASATGTSGRIIAARPITIDISINDSGNGIQIIEDLATVPSALLSKMVNTLDVADLTPAEVTARETALDDEYQAEKLWVTASGIFEFFHEWYRRTRRGDSEELGLNSVTLTDTGEIPLGFRIGDSNTTAAGMINMLTFVDVNDTTVSGYFEV